MLSKQKKEKRQEAVMLIMDDMIPEDHILKQIDKYVDFDFIYELEKILVRKTNDIFNILINSLNFANNLFSNKKLGYIYIF